MIANDNILQFPIQEPDFQLRIDVARDWICNILDAKSLDVAKQLAGQALLALDGEGLE